MKYLGIDPGLSGAVAVIEMSDLLGPVVTVYDTPTMKVKVNDKKRSAYMLQDMVAIVRQHAPDRVVIEKVGAMPGQGVTSMFSFGRGLGLWEGIVAALSIPYTLVAPQTWKKQMLSDMDKSEKDSSRLRAMQLFPGAADQLARKKDDGRAEALLLAEYARRFT